MSWENEARRILKSELARQGVTYGSLARRLQAIGIEETERSIANKMSRGRFSFVFYLQCLSAMGISKTIIDLSAASADPGRQPPAG